MLITPAIRKRVKELAREEVKKTGLPFHHYDIGVMVPMHSVDAILPSYNHKPKVNLANFIPEGETHPIELDLHDFGGDLNEYEEIVDIRGRVILDIYCYAVDTFCDNRSADLVGNIYVDIVQGVVAKRSSI